MVTYNGAGGALPIDLVLAAQMAYSWVEEWMHTPVKDMPQETIEHGFMGCIMLAVLGDRAELRKDARAFVQMFGQYDFAVPVTEKTWRKLTRTIAMSDTLDK